MGTRYPDQVGGHNPVCPLLRLLVPVPVRDVLATTVVVVSLVDTGPPRTSPVEKLVGVAKRVSWQ